MSQYQRIAILVLRLATFLSLVIGAAGILYWLLAIAIHGGRIVTPDARQRFLGAVFYLVLGAVGLAVARPVGRWLGRGLD